jgi:hypothetical protein
MTRNLVISMLAAAAIAGAGVAAAAVPANLTAAVGDKARPRRTPPAMRPANPPNCWRSPR